MLPVAIPASHTDTSSDEKAVRGPFVSSIAEPLAPEQSAHHAAEEAAGAATAAVIVTATATCPETVIWIT